MEHKDKLMATASFQSQGDCPESIIDRFSSLPDEVAHHILSFVNLKELTRLGSVSKRCRVFYLSTPSFKFDSSYSKNKQEQLSLLNSFDRLMIHRGDNKIQNFRIRLDFYAGLNDELFRLITWIHIAARCHVEVLDINLSVYKADMTTVELPSCIFLCGSLRSLSVSSSTVLKVPPSACSSNLQFLMLSDVSLDEGFSKLVSRSCKCIKELKLERVSVENITIESTSLESFSFVFPHCSNFCISGDKLVHIRIEWVFYKPGSRSLNVYAPNLKHFKWIGKLLNHQDLGKLTRLEKAEIFLKPTNDYDVGIDNIYEVLCSLSSVKVLILGEDTTKALFGAGSMPAAFNNISSLEMHIGSLNDDLVPAMVSLLSGMPNLNTFLILTYPSLLFDKPKSCGYNRNFWKSQNLVFVHQLMEVTIELSNGFNGLELARYILEHAQNLKKMDLFYLRKQSYVRKKVNASKMVSTARVVLQERQVDQERSRTGNNYGYYLLQLRY